MPAAIPELEVHTDDKAAAPARVILYNDDWHTFDEVAMQLIKAVGCSMEQGQAWAWEIHTQGRAVVFQGPRSECEKVAGVLREIRLQTEVDWD